MGISDDVMAIASCVSAIASSDTVSATMWAWQMANETDKKARAKVTFGAMLIRVFELWNSSLKVGPLPMTAHYELLVLP